MGHNEPAETVYDGVEYLGGNETVAQQCLLPLRPRGCHLFASLHWHADVGCSLEAIVITICYVTQQGLKKGQTVGIGEFITICVTLCLPSKETQIMLRYRDIPTHTTDVLDLTSLTVDEFEALVAPFEAAFLQYMAEWTFHGRCRQSRRYTTYK